VGRCDRSPAGQSLLQEMSAGRPSTPAHNARMLSKCSAGAFPAAPRGDSSGACNPVTAPSPSGGIIWWETRGRMDELEERLCARG
jgi:hypothetical protein